MEINELSVFFPAYNEEKSIKSTVTKAAKILPQVAQKWEIIVVNDGSTDKTGEVVEKLIIKDKRIRMITHTPNRGYGAALKTGFYNARYEWVAFTDADGSTSPEELYRMVESIGDWDGILGSRWSDESVILKKELFLSRLLNKVISST